MTPARWAEIVAVLEPALECAPDERGALLERACGADAALRAEVESLLAADDHAPEFLEAAIPGAAAVMGALQERLGDMWDAVGAGGPAWGDPAMDDSALEARLQATLGTAYHVGRELAGGGMSRVFVADDVHLGRRVAVKVVRAPETGAGFNVARFRREVRLAAALRHPHIVPLLAAGESADGLVYYTMPFVDGESLKQRLDRERPLPLAEVARVVSDVASALAYAHRRGVVHRDVKPANILVDEDQALVADFGIAKALSAAAGDEAGAESPRVLGAAADTALLTAGGLVLGTPAYISPEQRAGDGAVDGRTDVYSLGCVAYEMLTGAPPVSNASLDARAGRPRDPTAPRELVSRRRIDVSPAVDAAIAKALAQHPDDRWPTPTAFAQALADALAVPPGARAEPRAAPPSVPRPARWRRPALGVVIVLALVSAAVGAAALATRRPAEGARGTHRGTPAVPPAASRKPAVPPAPPTDNFEAYNYFLRAEALRANTTAERASRAQAVALYERATALDPRFALAYARLADVQSLIFWSYTDRSPERLARVEVAARRAVSLAPELPDARLALATYYYRAHRDYGRALEELSAAIARAPDRSDLYGWRGLIQRRAGRLAEAIASLRRADALQPGDPQRAADVAATSTFARAYPEATRYYDRVRTLAPAWAVGYAGPARVALDWHGDLAAARRVVHEGIRAGDPGQLVAELGYLSPALVAPGADTRAVLRAVPHTFNNRGAYLLWCADWWAQRGPTAKARAYADSARVFLEGAVRAHPDEAGLHDHLALAYGHLGRTTDALRESDRALALLPVTRDAYDGASYLESRAYLDTMVGEYDDAVARLQALLAMPSFVAGPFLRAAPVWGPLRTNPQFRRLIGLDR